MTQAKQASHKKLHELAALIQANQNSINDDSNYVVKSDSLWLNYQRNPINQAVIEQLIQLAKNSGIQGKIDDMFAGQKINQSEQRAVKHWLLRAPLNVNDPDSVEVHRVLDKMTQLVEKIHNHQLINKPITDVICLGIGGSELGTRFIYEALTMGKKIPINLHFVANVDSMAIADATAKSTAETTLFLPISKTFTTYETMKNFETAKQWFFNETQLSEAAFWQRCCAITSNLEAALNQGVPESQIFSFWDWVGGRYSLWSAVGLPIAIACGMNAFKELLAGAHAMDNHFTQKSLNENLPVILGLMHVWYSDYMGYNSRAVIPYAQNLKSLPDHLQQLEMESLGKSVSEQGESINHTTCPIVWGSVGSNAQHAFFQLLHQGTQITPLDFIAVLEVDEDILPGLSNNKNTHHTAILANCLAQSKALMQGGSTRKDKHGHFAGNRPSNFILLNKVTPFTLGELIAAYEHKVFVQSIIWGINAFDQFGVELGKQMCNEILAEQSRDISFEDIKKAFSID